MREMKQTVYTFDELTETAKSKVIEDFIKVGFCDLNLESYFYDSYYTEELTENGFNVTYEEFNYSLNNCQGDGVSFITSDIDTNKLIDLFVKDNPEFKRISNIVKKHCDIESKIYKTNLQYVHEKSVTFDNEITLVSYNDRNYQKINAQLDIFNDEFIDFVEEFRIDLCLKFEQCLYNEIEYLQSSENIQELCDCNNYEFFEDGSFYS